VTSFTLVNADTDLDTLNYSPAERAQFNLPPADE
jgi:hypothetical protein